MTAFYQSLKKTDGTHGSCAKAGKLKVEVCVAALTLLSLAFTILLTMFDLYGWKNWSLENFLLLRSFQISNSFLVWNVEDQVNSSIVIDAKYGTNITATTLTLGVTCTIMNLSGILQDFVIQDLTLLVALTLYYKTHEILDAFRKSDESKNMYYANLGENWNQCTALKGLSDSANEAFGVSLKLMHIKYLFTVTFVLLKWLKGDGIRIYDTIVALNICRIIFFYWIALKTSENGKACWRWVKKKSRLHADIRVHNEMVRTSILVDDLEADPIGIGTDNFLINEGFMIMMFGAVSSVFMIFAQQGQSCKCN